MKNPPLYIRIKQDIERQILYGALRPGDLVMSEADLSKRYFVSRITAQNALNALVDEGLVMRVRGKGTFVAGKPAEEGGELRLAENAGIVGFIIPQLTSATEELYVNAVQTALANSGFSMLLHISRESITEETYAIRSMIANGAKGIILFPVIEETYNPEVLQLSLNRFPTVLIDRRLQGVNLPSVTSDNRRAAYEATSFLIRKGHKNICFITPKNTNTAVEERIEGYEEALLEHGLKIGRESRFTFDFAFNPTELLYKGIRSHLRANPDVSAVICCDVNIADCALYVLREMKKFPSAAFDVISFDRPYRDDVSYVEQDFAGIAYFAVRSIIAQINGDFTAAYESVPTRFVENGNARGRMYRILHNNQ